MYIRKFEIIQKFQLTINWILVVCAKFQMCFVTCFYFIKGWESFNRLVYRTIISFFQRNESAWLISSITWINLISYFTPYRWSTILIARYALCNICATCSLCFQKPFGINLDKLFKFLKTFYKTNSARYYLILSYWFTICKNSPYISNHLS